MTTEEITAALARPFEPGAVKWKPGAVSGNRALALAYVDARMVQDRLDETLGVAGWQDEYTTLPDGSVVCKLSVRLGEQWLVKMDVGSPSEQPDEGDRLKAAFSDALKRAAVKFGIGRYLYRLPPQWVDYDPQKKRFAKEPRSAGWAQEGRPEATKLVDDAQAKCVAILLSAAREGGRSLLDTAWKSMSPEWRKTMTPAAWAPIKKEVEAYGR